MRPIGIVYRLHVVPVVLKEKRIQETAGLRQFTKVLQCNAFVAAIVRIFVKGRNQIYRLHALGVVTVHKLVVVLVTYLE